MPSRRSSKPRLTLAGEPAVDRPGDWSAPEVLADRQSVRLRARFRRRGNARHWCASTRMMFPYDPPHQTFVNFYERGTIATQAILDRARTRVRVLHGHAAGHVAVSGGSCRRRAPYPHRSRSSAVPDRAAAAWRDAAPARCSSSRRSPLAHSVTLVAGRAEHRDATRPLRRAGNCLSIVYVGADNLMVRGGRDVRAWIALAFGFIHGFGFADVLAGAGSAEPGARLVAVFLQSRRRNGSAGRRNCRRLALAALERAAKRPAAGWHLRARFVVIATGTVWFIQRVFFPGGMA